MRETKANKNYAVGYGKPPLSTRFKKGQRRRRRNHSDAKSLLATFKEIVAEKVQLAVGENIVSMTNAEAILYANKQEALKGNPSAVHNLMHLEEVLRKIQGDGEEGPEPGTILFPEMLSVEEFEVEAEKINAQNMAKAREGKL